MSTAEHPDSSESDLPVAVIRYTHIDRRNAAWAFFWMDPIAVTYTALNGKVGCKGPLIWVIILVLLQGFCGMSLGVLYSSLCSNENSAIQLSLGSFFPLLLLSGIIWPIESIPQWLRYISYCSPLTFAVEAIRCILARGLDIAFYAVWRGYLTTIGWIGGLILIGGIILRVKE